MRNTLTTRWRQIARPATLLILTTALLAGCYAVRGSSGGGDAKYKYRVTNKPPDVRLPPGYRIEAVARQLTFPTGVTFDAQGRPCVVESGYSYGEIFTRPRLLRIESNGAHQVIATGESEYAPWNGVTFHNGSFYIAEGGVQRGGRISQVTMDGAVTPLLANLPSMGDHHVNGPAIHGGHLYFAIGTATNSGVVGPDNYEFGWLQRHREFHDIPGRDIRLSGRNYTSPNPLSGDSKATATTGAYLPFGSASTPGQVIRGQVPCSGGIHRIPLGGGNVELVAWGLRNPFGLAFSPDGQLYATENQFDVRGSRPVWGTGDLLWRIVPGTWYGWPDYFSGEPLDRPDRFTAPGEPRPERLLAEDPNPPPSAVAKFGVHSSANGFDFSRSAAFGYEGDGFVALFGDMAPNVGKVLAPVGFKVVRVNPGSGVVEDFATNPGPRNGPASRLGTSGLERPIACRFSPDGGSLYVVDFGALTIEHEQPRPQPGTGTLWRITRENPHATHAQR